MKTIKIRVPNKSYDKEMEVIDAVSALLSKMRKTLNVEIQQGQGGTLDDWKEVDFGNKDGRLMVIKVSLRDKKDLIKDAGKHYKRALKDYNRFFKVKKVLKKPLLEKKALVSMQGKTMPIKRLGILEHATNVKNQ